MPCPYPEYCRETALPCPDSGVISNVTEETAMPCPYPEYCRETALPCPIYHSGNTGIDTTQNPMIKIRK